VIFYPNVVEKPFIFNGRLFFLYAFFGRILFEKIFFCCYKRMFERKNRAQAVF